MADELEPVVFEVLAEIAAAQANLVEVQEELSNTAAHAAEVGAQITESLTGVEGSLTEAAASAAEASAFIGTSLGNVDGSFAEMAGSAGEAAAGVADAMGGMGGSLADAAGAASDAYVTISDNLNSLSSDAESAASSVDDASGEMGQAFSEVTTGIEEMGVAADSASATMDGAMTSVGAAAEAMATEVGAAEAAIADAALAAGDALVEEGAKGKEAGAEVAAGAHEATSALKEMAEAFALFEAFEFLKESVTDAANAEGAMNLLNTAIQKTGESAQAMAPEVAEVDEHLKALGFGAAQSNSGIAKLTQMLGNSEQALRLSGLAADLARAKQIDYSAAIRTVGMAATGHVGLLARLGLQTKDAAGHTLSAKAAIDAMAHSFQGTAQAYSGTMAGKMQVFKADMEEAREKVGNALIPALEKLMPTFIELANVIGKDVVPVLATIGKFYVDHKKQINFLIGVLAALWLSLKVGKGAMMAYKLATEALAGAQAAWAVITGEATLAEEGLNAALLANPIGLVIAAIVALGLVFVYAWKHSETFRNIVTGVWTAIEKVTGDAVAAIINYYIRPLVTAYLWMAEKVVDAVDWAFGWIPGVGGKLDDAKDAVHQFADDTDAELKKWADNASKWGDKGASAVSDAHKKVKKAGDDVTKDGDPFKDYSQGLSDTVPGATKAHSKAKDKHKKTNEEIRKEQRDHDKKMLDEAKAAAKKREEVLKAQVQAAKDAAAKQAAILQQQLAEAQNKFDFAQKQLEAQAAASIQFVNGQLSNVGLSMINLGYAGNLAALSGRGGGGGGATVVNVNVAGSVVTQQDLVSGVQQGLLQTQRTNSSLGIVPAGS